MTKSKEQQIIDNVRQQIDAAAARSGRRSEDITLLAVTKMHGPQEINEAISCGITDIGENKVQELLSKYDDIQKGVRWHFIGHLQTNKVKSIVDKVDMIQSVDSLHLAEEIDRRCKAIGKTMDILIQVNAAGEVQKSGIAPQELFPLIDEINKLSNLRIRGLMQVAPDIDDTDALRHYFKTVKDLFDKIPGADILSMGMSGDFEIAIEEGATMVRIGTKIFGERNY